ncbi:hypothetical protein [Chryseobacterium oncorhynchi]|uniref:Uncharacterized protein n=1 Tax=Chryseobacterium oncorhynchi TaxID=741074 RepID=A0A316WF10_9FLAO|nr:hypothetical protein [Chryseobacterium oncorhynchi]PWN60004.1 hypothetical protein C1638_020780 [Chryseobacterium oncorhynchi]
MEENIQENYKDFFLSVLPNYVELIGTEEDVFDEYRKLFQSLQEFSKETELIILKPVIINLINYLKLGNDISMRMEVGNTFLSLLRNEENSVHFLHKWNDYISKVELKSGSYTVENKGNKISKEVPLYEKGLKYFLYIHMYQDEFADPIEIFSERELLVGDHLDFSDHQMCDELEELFKTPMFKVIKRQYLVQYGEMHLQLEPYIA